MVRCVQTDFMAFCRTIIRLASVAAIATIKLSMPSSQIQESTAWFAIVVCCFRFFRSTRKTMSSTVENMLTKAISRAPPSRPTYESLSSPAVTISSAPRTNNHRRNNLLQ